MAIPDYQGIMLPLLRFSGDQKEHSVRETVTYLGQEMKLTEEEKKELLPSGQQPVFDNRVQWAKTYLIKAGLLESPQRAIFKITPRGLDVLSQNPPELNYQFLMQFPEFSEFWSASREREPVRKGGPEAETGKTPEEIMEATYQEIKQTLAQELLGSVKKCSPQFFEKLVVELLVKMGYGGSRRDAAKAIGRSGDEGIDGIIKEDRLGLDCIYVQAKRWDSVVGRPEIQKFAGALQGMRAKKGIFITTSSFTNDAEQYVSKIDSKIILVDGEMLSQFMIDFGIGTSTIVAYELKKIDTDYFVDE